MYSVITKQAITGIVAGVSAAILLKIIGLVMSWFVDPRLKLCFKEKDTYTIAPIENNLLFLFTHLTVQNKRKSTAYGCKVFLLKIEKKENGKFKEVPMNVHYTLKWANENEPKGYEGLEIPGNYRRRIDLASAQLGSTQYFALFVEGGLRGITNTFTSGEYRFILQATGKNTNTITKRFIFKWSDSFVKDNIQIEEENIFVRLWFKICRSINF